MYILDTDILVDIQRGHKNAMTWFHELSDIPSIPSFAVMELIQGSKNKEQTRKVLQLVTPSPIIWATEADCERALLNFTTYRLSNNMGLVDSLIAACAVGRGLTLCTFNIKHYRVVPNLLIVQPYQR